MALRDRGLRPDRGHAHRGPGRRATDRSTGCACPGSTPAPASRRSWARRTTASGRSRRPTTGPSRLVATAAHRWSWRPSSGRAHGDVRVIDCMPPRREHPRIARVVEGVRGSVPMRTRFKPRFDYGRIVPWLMRSGNVLHATAGPDALELRSDVELVGHDMEHSAEFTVSEGDRVGFVIAPGIPPSGSRRAPDRRGHGRRRHRGVVAGVGRALHVRRRVGGRRRALPHHAEGPDVRADRRDRRGAHDVPAGVPRGRPELGLPLLLDPRRRSDAGRADGSRLRGRGRELARLDPPSGRRRPGGPPDHVRAVRRAPARRVRAGLAPRATRGRRRCASATPPPGSCSSTCTASSATRSTALGSSGCRRRPTPGTSRRRSSTGWRRTGGTRTTACGRSGGRGGTSSTRR